MDKVRVKREELIGILEANRKKHVEEYEQAYKEFRVAGLKALKDRVEAFGRDETDDLNIRLSPPISHEDEYTNTDDFNY